MDGTIEILTGQILEGKDYSEFDFDPDDILRYLEIAPADYFRHLYNEGILTPNMPLTRFDLDCFLGFLTSQGFDMQSKLYDQGVILDEDDEIRLTDIFWSVAISAANNHQVRQNDFSTCLEGCTAAQDGINLYLSMHFDITGLPDQVAGIFCLEKPGIHSGNLRETGIKYLRYQIAQRFISPAEREDIWTEMLLRKAVELELITVSETKAHTHLPAEILEALTVFGMAELPAEKDLKVAYRNAIKEHHPDKNSHGHEQTILLNAAYARLLAYLSLIPA